MLVKENARKCYLRTVHEIHGLTQVKMRLARHRQARKKKSSRLVRHVMLFRCHALLDVCLRPQGPR